MLVCSIVLAVWNKLHSSLRYWKPGRFQLYQDQSLWDWAQASYSRPLFLSFSPSLSEKILYTFLNNPSWSSYYKIYMNYPNHCKFLSSLTINNSFSDTQTHLIYPKYMLPATKNRTDFVLLSCIHIHFSPKVQQTRCFFKAFDLQRFSLYSILELY